MATWDDVRELGYPAVLAKLDSLSRDRLAVIVTDAWLAVAPKKLVAEYEARGG